MMVLAIGCLCCRGVKVYCGEDWHTGEYGYRSDSRPLWCLRELVDAGGNSAGTHGALSSGHR